MVMEVQEESSSAGSAQRRSSPVFCFQTPASGVDSSLFTTTMVCPPSEAAKMAIQKYFMKRSSAR